MSVTELIGGVLVRLPFWALFASPLIGLLWWVAGHLRKRAVRNPSVRWLFALVAGVLLAPMPLGMFLGLVPAAYLSFGGLEYFAQVWQWALVSTILTFAATLLAAWKPLAPSNNSSKPTPLRGAA